ncbi:MAG: hypothetical protein GY903_00375 [Fuerstiella sp.]|nr:hypothetical protein [Fuerstiella sp.]MCP4852933.1 hypothetical protein [Fuerstiella sp.]
MVFGNRQKKMTLANVLHGCTPGRIQSVGYMQVIPLVSDLSDCRFVSPVEGAAEVFTTEYETLGFRNPSDCLLIVPCHAGYVVKHAAQDHAMAHAGVVRSLGERKFDTAMCVQQSQGGYIKRGDYRMLILPYALRERALEVRKNKNYNKLWDAISVFNQEMGVQAAGHLEFFLKHFQKELDEFVAEFECVPGQIGAIILVDDQVVGVERAPSHSYWKSVWPCLVRECYGSLAIRIAQLKSECAVVPASRTTLPDDIRSLDELDSLIAEIAHQEDERARATVRELLDEQLLLTRDESTEGLSIDTVRPGRFTGQVIRDGDRVVYASLPVTKKWLAKNKWQTALPFTI